MTIVVGSIFRNAVKYLPRWQRQIEALNRGINNYVWVIAVEGDSTDGTSDNLLGYLGASGQVTYFNHGGEDYGHVDDSRRWKQVADTCNCLLEEVAPLIARRAYDYDDIEAFVYVESDLVWQPSTIMTLIDGLAFYDAIAPMCFWMRNGQFYDTWGYRKDGELFQPKPPYHPGIPPVGLIDIDSAGSCIVMKPEVALQCRFQPEDGIVGWCRDMQAKGFRLGLNPGVAVMHPSNHGE